MKTSLSPKSRLSRLFEPTEYSHSSKSPRPFPLENTLSDTTIHNVPLPIPHPDQFSAMRAELNSIKFSVHKLIHEGPITGTPSKEKGVDEVKEGEQQKNRTVKKKIEVRLERWEGPHNKCKDGQYSGEGQKTQRKIGVGHRKSNEKNKQITLCNNCNKFKQLQKNFLFIQQQNKQIKAQLAKTKHSLNATIHSFVLQNKKLSLQLQHKHITLGIISAELQKISKSKKQLGINIDSLNFQIQSKDIQSLQLFQLAELTKQNIQKQMIGKQQLQTFQNKQKSVIKCQSQVLENYWTDNISMTPQKQGNSYLEKRNLLLKENQLLKVELMKKGRKCKKLQCESKILEKKLSTALIQLSQHTKTIQELNENRILQHVHTLNSKYLCIQ